MTHVVLQMHRAFFDFLVFLYFWFDILVITKAATDKVQVPFLNIGVSCQLIESCIQQFLVMRANNDHFEATIAKTRDRCEALDLLTDFATGRSRRRRAFFDESNETAVDDPADDAKQKFKIDVYNVVLDTIVTELKTRFNDTTVGVLKTLQCISPVRFLDKHEDVSVISPAKSSLDQLKTLCQFYSEDLSSNEMV